MKTKKESRVLVYGLSRNHIVIATYRWDFLEELFISKHPTLDLEVFIRDKLSTYSEVTYVLPCTESKYRARFKSFKILEGGDILIYVEKYCKLINAIICLLETGGLISPATGILIGAPDKCLSKGEEL